MQKAKGALSLESAPFTEEATRSPPKPRESLFRKARVILAMDGRSSGASWTTLSTRSTEASLSAFEEGVALSQQCAGQLEVAERRIEVLTREGGDWVARQFGGTGASGEDADDDPEAG